MIYVFPIINIMLSRLGKFIKSFFQTAPSRTGVITNENEAKIKSTFSVSKMKYILRTGLDQVSRIQPDNSSL
jgi:hypothetical protein